MYNVRRERSRPFPEAAASLIARLPRDYPARYDWHNLFQAETSFMTFEGLQIQGAIKIMEKLTVSNVSFHRSEIDLQL